MGEPRAVSRRSFLGRAAVTGAGAVVAGGAGFGIGRETDASGEGAAKPAVGPVPFYAARQAGVVTPQQDRLAFAAFDVTTADKAALMGTLGAWSAAAARMAAGEPIGATETLPANPPVDTGEAVGLDPAGLTITVGFGPTLFDERFGLAAKRPAVLRALPAFQGDALQPTRTGGDLCVQACANDPQVAFHVIRNFARIGRGTVVMRWSQLGFGRTSSTSTTQATPRNLFGFKDGTNNIKAENSADMEKFVWIGGESDQGWIAGGTYLVARRIRMLIESWDANFLGDQERIFGRFKDSGAPLSGKNEFDKVNLAATEHGKPVIDPDSHIRLASATDNSGEKILRRGYSFTDGTDPTSGQLDAGLFFICFNSDPARQFIPIQQRLAAGDAMNEYVQHTGSGLFAIPPGVREVGDWFGKELFG